MSKAAFIGLGVMGFPMAGHLARGGHTVTVYHRSAHQATTCQAQRRGRNRRDTSSLMNAPPGLLMRRWLWPTAQSRTP